MDETRAPAALPPEPPAEAAPPPGAAPEDAAPSEAERDEADEAFALRLPAFEGPLELLLHLIEREELDITEVSLVAVTGQYLEHLRRRDRIDLAAVASFVAVGARLLLLKSRALLPRPEAEPDGGGDEERDPEALLEALREYRRYRAAAEHLRGLEDEHRTAYRRETPPPEVPPGAGLDGVTAEALLALFREALERLPREEPEAGGPQPRPVRLEDRVRRLVARLEGGAPLRFRDLIAAASSRAEVIVDFLAVLELVRAGYAEARQDGAFGEIELAAVPGAAPPPAAAQHHEAAPRGEATEAGAAPSEARAV